MRTEKDFLGEVQLPVKALYGINAWRARQNFPENTPFHIEWYEAIGAVKLACYQTYRKFIQGVEKKFKGQKLPLRKIEPDVLKALINTAKEVSFGKHFRYFIVPAVQGGAGTSINMNINEIIANGSLKKLQLQPGHYEKVDPLEDANVYQSTNDVVPTALKVASIKLLLELEDIINKLRTHVEGLEQKGRKIPRTAFTQLQEALPSNYGMFFGAYSEALSRDWWRVSKCFERIKMVNLGGGAAGTGMSIPRFFIMEVVPALQKITNLPITRSENLPDATSNLDNIVEVHAILKSHAINLEKLAADLRMLAADLNRRNEISIPKKQLGSSIMPGKVNPVIAEFVISSAHKVYSNDQLISSLCGQGQLDLNAYIPAIGHALLESIKLLIAAGKSLGDNMLADLSIHADVAEKNLFKSPSITTALSPYVGYHKASKLAKQMKEEDMTIFEANRELKIMEESKLKDILAPDKLSKLGFTIQDLIS